MKSTQKQRTRARMIINPSQGKDPIKNNQCLGKPRLHKHKLEQQESNSTQWQTFKIDQPYKTHQHKQNRNHIRSHNIARATQDQRETRGSKYQKRKEYVEGNN